MVSLGKDVERQIDDVMLTAMHAILLRKTATLANQNFLSTIAIKAKDLAAEMTSVNVQQKDLHGQVGIEREHIDNNCAVRNMLLNRGIRPEALPPAEDVKKVERRLKSDVKKILPQKKK